MSATVHLASGSRMSRAVRVVHVMYINGGRTFECPSTLQYHSLNSKQRWETLANLRHHNRGRQHRQEAKASAVLAEDLQGPTRRQQQRRNSDAQRYATFNARKHFMHAYFAADNAHLLPFEFRRGLEWRARAQEQRRRQGDQQHR